MDTPEKRDPYDVVLADLRARRKVIDNTIAMLEQIRANGLPGLPNSTEPEQNESAKKPISLTGPGTFLGLTIGDAAKKLLATEHRPMQTAEIVSGLERGGVVINAVDKTNNVGSILLRRFYNSGDIVRVSRGVWGLQEWYPNRKFNKKGDDATKVEEQAPSVANEQRTEPDRPTAGHADWVRHADLRVGPRLEEEGDR